MRRIFVFCLLFLAQQCLWACGFNFTGSCSSFVFLEINNTLDSFAVAKCDDYLAFEGINLGSIRSLRLPRVQANTWESCQNNVTAMSFFYRLTSEDGVSNDWQELDLPQIYALTTGPYYTRYRKGVTDVDLLAGLETGLGYTLEVYYMAQVDTIGNDSIPETIL
jgi:hypothetical protein